MCYVSYVSYFLSPVTCRLSPFTYHLPPATCHPTGTVTDPPPGNFPTMHIWLVHQDRSQNPKQIKIQNIIKSLQKRVLDLAILATGSPNQSLQPSSNRLRRGQQHIQGHCKGKLLFSLVEQVKLIHVL